MRISTPSLLLLLCVGCSSPGALAPSPGEDVRLQEATNLLQQGKVDEALLITDELLNANPRLRRARLLAGDGNRLLADQQNRDRVAFLRDAERQYRRALDLDGNDPQTEMSLAYVCYQLERYESGRNAAMRAAGLHTSSKPPKQKERAEAFLLAAHNEFRILQQVRRAEKQDGEKPQPETLARANALLALLEQAKQKIPGQAIMLSTAVYRSMEGNLAALKELERGLQAAPEDTELHDLYRRQHADLESLAQCIAYYRGTIRDHGASAGMVFGLARAQYDLAAKKKTEKAYLDSARSFARCQELRPAWKESCKKWQSDCYVNAAQLGVQAGNAPAARRALKSAFEADQGVAENRSYLWCLNQLGQVVQSGMDAESLQAGFDYWEEVVARHPDQLGWVYNNAAFTARDLGTAVGKQAEGGTEAERKEAAKQAKAIWERSYALYCKAVELSPDDPRIVNDCGLMLIYHLHRDEEQALNLFERAIRLGKKQLAELPEDTSVEDRQALEEAVGDAYQNTCQHYIDQGKPFADYKSLLEEAVGYYPYQQREAARWLAGGGKKEETAKPATTQPDPRDAAFTTVVNAAQKRATLQDYDGALLKLDAVARRMQGHAPFHYHLGLYSLKYAKKTMAAGGSGALIDGLLADARLNLQKAVELNSTPIEPRLHLGQANYESSEFETAAKIADSLLLHIASQGGTSKKLLAAAQELRALAGTRVYLLAKQAEKDNPGELQAARNAYRSLEKTGALDTVVARQWSGLEEWAGAKDEAVDIFARAVGREPDSQNFLDDLVSRAGELGASARAVTALGERKDALGLWYRGKALFQAAMESSEKTSTFEQLHQATAAFRAVIKANKDYAANSKAWIAICLGKEGYLQLEAKDFDAALKLFLEAAAERPDRATADIGGGQTIKLGIQTIVDHHFRGEDLASAIKTLEAATKILHSDADLANDLGLFSRDRGAALERAGKKEEARALFELSFSAYEKALQLEPRSLRQQNDLAVIMIYHLGRDLDRARSILRHCIKEGDRRLAEEPPSDKQELQDLQETVGDSYENLGYYLMTYKTDKEGEEGKEGRERARKMFEKSLEYYPFKSRRSTQHLRTLKR